MSPCPWWPIVSAVKTTAACCSVRTHDKCHILPSYVTLLPIEGPICMLLGAVKPMQFTAFCLSGVCVQKQHHAGFVFGDEISLQNDLLTPDQSFPTSHTQSLKDCVSVLQCMAISIYSDLYSNLKLNINDVVLWNLNAR